MSAFAAFADLLAESEDDLPWHIDPTDDEPRDEFARQIAVQAKVRMLCPGVELTAIPNAGKASDWERVRRWREGAKAGALDLDATWKPTRPGDRGCAFIEMKDGKKMPTRTQRDRLNLLTRQGHNCGVFRHEDSAIAALRRWGAPFL